MLGKVKKRVGRVGLQPVKLHFSVQSEAVSFPDGCLVADQSILSISLDRKTKSVATGSFVYRRTCGEVVEIILPKENLEMVAILYRDTRTGRFQKKSASLVLRELVKRGVLGQFNYNVIARCYLNLHEVANELDCKTTAVGRGIVKFENLKGVVLKFTVTATIQSVAHECQYQGNEDTASEMSDVSHLSELTTDAPHDGIACSVPVFESLPPPIGSYLDSISGGLQGMQESPEEEEGSREGSREGSHSVGGGSDEIPTGTSSHESTLAVSSASTSNLPISTAPADFTATKEMFSLYDQELQRRGEHIALLERRLAEQSAQFSATTAAQCTEIATLKSTLHTVKGGTGANNDASNHCSNPFDEPSQPDLSPDALTDQIHQLTVDLQQSLDHATFLRQALEEEMHMAREAAAVAANNAVLRAEAEDEYQTLLVELIATKMEKANLSMQMDALSHENHTLCSELEQLRRGELSDKLECHN